MKFTEEQMKKMNAAKSADELIALAKAEGIEAGEEEIKAQFDAMHKEGEIADEELNNVAGGCGKDYERPKTVQMGIAPDGATVCPKCLGGLAYGYYQKDPNGDKYDPVSCYRCQLNFRHYWIGNSWTEA